MESRVLQSVEGRTLTFDDGSTLAVEAGVHVKLDGQTSDLAALKAGDRVEQHTDGDKLVTLKVRRETPEGVEATTSEAELARRATSGETAPTPAEATTDAPSDGDDDE